MVCRFCKTELEHVFIDLVNCPASNSFLSKEQLNEPEIFYPLKVYTCHNCFLVQIDEYKNRVLYSIMSTPTSLLIPQPGFGMQGNIPT